MDGPEGIKIGHERRTETAGQGHVSLTGVHSTTRVSKRMQP